MGATFDHPPFPSRGTRQRSPRRHGTAAPSRRVARSTRSSHAPATLEAGCMFAHLVSSNSTIAAVRRRTVASLAWLLVVTSVAAAQSTGVITGRVTDASSDTPVPDAQVRVIGSVTGVMTRSDGSYRLVIAPGRYDIRVSRI